MPKPTGKTADIQNRTLQVKGLYDIHRAISKMHSMGANICGVCVTPIWGEDGAEVCERYLIVYQSVEEIDYMHK